jgi:RimJ/RimL family protein N-acetyltransferase
MPRSQPARPPATPLSDGIVTIRARLASDVDAVVAASHDPETQRWLEDDPLQPLTDDAARQAALERVEDAWRSGRAAPLIVADALSDEPMGLVNLQFRDDRTATIAYSVFPAHRGRGVAPRAVELVTPWARADLGVEVLLLEADAENAASIRVAEKCGFRPVDEVVSTDALGRERRTRVFRQTASDDPPS